MAKVIVESTPTYLYQLHLITSLDPQWGRENLSPPNLPQKPIRGSLAKKKAQQPNHLYRQCPMVRLAHENTRNKKRKTFGSRNSIEQWLNKLKRRIRQRSTYFPTHKFKTTEKWMKH